MLLGYVDSNERLYDLGFGTLKMKMRVESHEGAERVVFSKASGEGEIAYRVLASADVTASLSMDHDGHAIPLLRPVQGRALRHEGGLVFIASPRERDSEEPGFFLVQVRAMPSALKFFFEDREGTEFVSVPRDEALRVAEGPRAITLYVSAESVALPKEKIAYALELAPVPRAAPLLSGFGMSP
ncbi:MAG TPA: hypothetical protein VEY12_06960 [Thermoplasmata archaeon]|nr:hypothetical protein [Thermoplasmata archaeon]